jgi:hypothetical protein
MLESAGEWLGATAKQAAKTLGVAANSSRGAGGRKAKKKARKSRKR